MSSDGIKRLEASRSFYRSQDTTSNSEVERRLGSIKAELKILNDELANRSYPVTNATNSPYLPDQNFYYRDVVFNSEEETSWKEVKSYDQIYNKSVSFNIKKLNII